METRIDPEHARHGNRSVVTYWVVLRRASMLWGGLHLVLGALFALLGVTGLSRLNVGFAVVWWFVQGLFRHRHNTLALVLVWFVICAHVLSAVLYLGWDSGFHYYLLPMVPFLIVNTRRQTLPKLLLVAALAAGYLALDVYTRSHPPLHPIGPRSTDLLRYLNATCTIGYLGYLAHVYVNVVGRVEQRLLVLATTDSLTGLANRRRAMEIAAYEISRRQRTGLPLCFAMADIDFFKRINDQHGHEAGDRVLANLAAVLRRSVREVDTLARWGGEEFLLVLPGTGAQEALMLAERAREAVARAEWPLGLSVTMTFGISCLAEGESFDQAVARADNALYRGKQAGRNRCVLDAAASG